MIAARVCVGVCVWVCGCVGVCGCGCVGVCGCGCIVCACKLVGRVGALRECVTDLIYGLLSWQKGYILVL